MGRCVSGTIEEPGILLASRIRKGQHDLFSIDCRYLSVRPLFFLFFLFLLSKSNILEFSIRNATCYRDINPTCCACVVLIQPNWQRDEDISTTDNWIPTTSNIPRLLLSRRKAHRCGAVRRGEHTASTRHGSRTLYASERRFARR